MFNLLRNDLGLFLLMVPAVLIALVVHEVSHGYVAYLCGDNTAKAYGRLTLNPLKHLDPFGAIMMLLIGFGYARPVPVNYRNLRKPRARHRACGAGGAAVEPAAGARRVRAVFRHSSDLCRFGGRALGDGGGRHRWLPSPAAYYDQNWLMNALFMGEVPRLLTTFMQFLTLFATVNIGLALFNLVPLPPLDGSKILGSLLPPQTAARYLRLEYYSRFFFLGIVLLSWLFPSLYDIVFWPLEFLRTAILNFYQWLMLLLF